MTDDTTDELIALIGQKRYNELIMRPLIDKLIIKLQSTGEWTNLSYLDREELDAFQSQLESESDDWLSTRRLLQAQLTNMDRSDPHYQGMRESWNELQQFRPFMFQGVGDDRDSIDTRIEFGGDAVAPYTPPFSPVRYHTQYKRCIYSLFCADCLLYVVLSVL